MGVWLRGHGWHQGGERCASSQDARATGAGCMDASCADWDNYRDPERRADGRPGGVETTTRSS
eukprot:8009107-Heterocapsa_arctica.AAC.1